MILACICTFAWVCNINMLIFTSFEVVTRPIRDAIRTTTRPAQFIVLPSPLQERTASPAEVRNCIGCMCQFLFMVCGLVDPLGRRGYSVLGQLAQNTNLNIGTVGKRRKICLLALRPTLVAGIN